jgi:amidohydrolase
MDKNTTHMTDKIKDMLPALLEIRREIHRNPELSEKEFETADRIKRFLKKHSNAEVKTVAKTGVLAVFDSGADGPSLMLRADTDALPISEINEFEHKSNMAGVSHKCGHDGHTAIMLGVAMLLTKKPIKNGQVVLLFQPSEENGMGAQAVLDDAEFKKLKFDFVFALHNIPGFEKNQIIIKERIFNANVKSMVIKLEGKTAHAAEPEKGYNPAIAISEILKFSKQLTFNKPDEPDFFLITPVHVKMGELAYGISAGSGEVHLTIRSWDLNLFKAKCQELESFIENICAFEKLSFRISWTQVFYANQNDDEAISYIRKAADANGFETHNMGHSFKWGEDFGLFTQRTKGAMFGLGTGKETPALHNPDYDFPDDITETGIKQFYQIIQEILKA